MGGLVGIVEQVLVLGLLFLTDLFLLGGILNRLDVLGVQHIDSTVGTHHRNLGGWPGVHEVSPQVLAAHDYVGSAVAFP